jgi:hypothetical protein
VQPASPVDSHSPEAFVDTTVISCDDQLQLAGAFFTSLSGSAMNQLSKFLRGELGVSRQFWLLSLGGLLVFAILFWLGHVIFFQTRIRLGEVLSLAYGFLWVAMTITAVWRAAATVSGAPRKILAGLCCAVAAASLAGLLAGLLLKDHAVLRYTFPIAGFWHAFDLAQVMLITFFSANGHA